jgi:hypothetical protein
MTIMLYLLFFLLRDGHSLAGRIKTAVPLSREYKQRLFSNFTTVIRATVKGNVLVAIAQGALGGLIFWFLHVQAPLLWAVVMAFLSLLPAVGAAIVWAPVAVYFLVTGSVWQGVALIAFGVFVIGLVDNFLRPVLVGKDTKMPDYVVLLSTVGGMALFGLNGFVIGPVTYQGSGAMPRCARRRQHRRQVVGAQPRRSPAPCSLRRAVTPRARRRCPARCCRSAPRAPPGRPGAWACRACAGTRRGDHHPRDWRRGSARPARNRPACPCGSRRRCPAPPGRCSGPRSSGPPAAADAAA